MLDESPLLTLIAALQNNVHKEKTFLDLNRETR